MKCTSPNLSIALAGLMLAARIAGPPMASASDANSKSQKVEGVVVEVSSVTLKLTDRKGNTFTVTTDEDYSDRVSTGAQVTAWIRQAGESRKLERLDYPLEFLAVAPAEFVPSIHKVILLPSSNAGDATTILEEIERLFETRCNWVIAHRMLAEEVRQREMKARGIRPERESAGDTSAPAELIPADPELIQKVAASARADAVLEVRAEYVLVKVKSHTAEWDGQREGFGTTGSRIASAMTMRSPRGQMPASTFVLRLFDRQGKLLWSQRRGFRLLALQVNMGGDLRDRPLVEAVTDSAFVSNWLSQVFAAWSSAGAGPGSKPAPR